ncbi:hypothetical protein H6P81_002355 [Aristolochia fimbriata]|uniref:Uncharacterized protein n=1 Tax=Aristolochia fimbriata TaxID=158543 RepID=A0AAV7FDM2_ARIFI|nr:hypothetical protein H6P81_002355 [Aristolochia fimbriata]
MKAKLLDARPLMNVCGHFGFVPDLTHYHVNPGNAPLVVVQLCDDECPEDFIKVLLYLSVLSFQMILLFSNVERCELLETRLIAIYIYIAKATGIVAADGFPVVVGERLDLDIHFMYIEGAAKTGQIKDVKVSYPLPCMPTTCFDILKDMGKKFHQGLTLSVRSFLPDDPLVQQCEKRLRDASYLKRDELLRIYIAKATGIVLPMVFLWLSEKDDPLVEQCEKRLRGVELVETDLIVAIYIAKATGIVSAYGFPVVVGERLDSDIHFKYIEGSSKTGQIEYVKRVTKESKFYDPEKTKNLLMKAKLLDARPLMNVCGRFGFVPDLTHYHAAKEYPQELGVNACIRLFEQFKSYEGSYFFLWTYLCSRLDPDIHLMYIEGAAKTGQIKDVNPRKAPLVVVQLCDDECPEDFIKVLLYLSVLSFQMILLFSNVERRELVETRRIAAYILRRPLVLYLPMVFLWLLEKGEEILGRLFEQFKSYEGLYFFLGRYLSSRLDPDIHFKHTEGVAKTGQINYVERVTRESKFYDPEKKKNLLMKAMLPDARPLINVNPGNGPLVVVQLLDDECPEDFINLSVLSFQRILLWCNVDRRELVETRRIAAYILRRPLVLYLPMVFLWLLEKGEEIFGRSYPLPCMPTICFDILKDMAKKWLFSCWMMSVLKISSRSYSICPFFPSRGSSCGAMLRDAGYLKRDELQRLYIAKATDIVSAYGFPVVVGERLDPDIHFKHSEGVAKTGQINYVERVTRESKFYDPEKKKNLLMKAMLPDARPLINVCGRFGFVPDLTHYDVNPGNGPLVVVQLLDDECPEDFINLSVLSFQRILLWCNVDRRELVETRRIAAYILRRPLAAKVYPQPLGVDACIRLFEQFKSYEGSYFFLGTYLSSRLDPDIHFKHIEGAAKKMARSNMLNAAAKEYPQPLGVDACIRLFEQFKSYEGLYFFLGRYLSSRLDPDIHFKHTEGVAKTGQINYVERVTRESKFYDPEEKEFAHESYATGCQASDKCLWRFGFVPDLTHYHVNPGNGPLVVVQLLDDECPEDFINLSVLSFQRILLWLIDAIYLKRDELLRIYIAKATGIVSAYGFPVVVRERLDPDIHFKHVEGAAKTG